MKIGAHISTSGGLITAFDRAAAIGAECLQIFESAPQQWGTARLEDAQVEEFRARLTESSLTPLFIHGKYLMNLASADAKIFKTSASTLRSSLNIAGRIGARGVIFHTGSHKGLGMEAVFDQICEAATRVLGETPEDTWMIFENSAGQGGVIGSKFSELGAIIKQINNPRAKVCMDTCHAFASGYDLRDASGVTAALAEFDEEIGLENLAAIHCNDSKADLGAGRDLHENIGDGKIGRAGFAALLAHPAIADVPLLLEVPGYKIDGASKGPDKPNIDRLKEIRTEVAPLAAKPTQKKR
jgi:apurinic endonuclease APN1